jgi:hypothetical protein
MVAAAQFRKSKICLSVADDGVVRCMYSSPRLGVIMPRVSNRMRLVHHLARHDAIDNHTFHFYLPARARNAEEFSAMSATPRKAAKYLVPFSHHLLDHPMNIGKRSAKRGVGSKSLVDQRYKSSPGRWPASTRQKASSSRLRLSLRKQLASALAIKVVLLDGLKLANLMIGHGIGVTTESVYEIKRIDSDYFDLA